MPNVSRRKYQKIIKFLTSIVGNEGLKDPIRMRATERLDNLYARHELAEQAAEGRKFRLEMARLKSITLPSVGGGTEQDAADKEDDAEEKEQARIALVFANLVKPKEEEENDPTD